MKIRIKVDELVNLLIQKQEAPILKKYRLDKEKVVRIQKSLREGNWRFA